MKYVIIGYGNIGKKRYNALGKKCVATVDPFQENVTYQNYKNAPFDAFDVAILSVPNSVKIDMLKYLLSNSKHVLVEKPLLFNDEKIADELSDIAKKNNVIWYTSYNHRFEPLVIKLKKVMTEKGIGDFYFGRFVYGNGSVQNIKDTWRDSGYGVLEDLGCHLIDIISYLFPEYTPKYKIDTALSFEAKSRDYCAFSTVDGKIECLCTTLMWKNTFTIDVFGSKGSIHLDGLRKWGESQLIYRKRIFPSGIPKEKIFISSGADDSWVKDIDFFEEMVSLGKSSYENDLYISQSINSLISNYSTFNKGAKNE